MRLALLLALLPLAARAECLAATAIDRGVAFTRWTHVPDLGFGLETRVTTATDDRKLGLVEMRAR